MTKLFFASASFFGMTAVLLGAFGAHALKNKLPENLLHSYETAVQYQFIHTLALLAVALFSKQLLTPITGQADSSTSFANLLNGAGISFIVGVVLFSGSLYLLSLTTLRTVGFINIGLLTPIGGLCFVIGWALLLCAAIQQ